MFHILFDSRGAGLLSGAMDMDESLDGETILIRDDYSVGPIMDLFSEEGGEVADGVEDPRPRADRPGRRERSHTTPGSRLSCTGPA